MRHRRLIFALLAWAVAASLAADAPNTRRVEVTGEVYGVGRTPEQARREALERAREKAVAEVAGIRVAAEQVRLRSERPGPDLDAFSSLVRTTAHGRILAEEVSWDTRIEDGVPVYRAHLVADVLVEEGAPDPGFVLDVRTVPATHVFRDGESVVVEIAASRDCYVTVLNVLSDGSVGVLFPNRYAAGNFVETGVPFALGGAGGFSLRASVDRGREREYEQLLVIATLDAVPLRLDTGDGEGVAADFEDTLDALNRWLVRIPPARRTEALFDYEVTR
jgi:hypothetical protein